MHYNDTVTTLFPVDYYNGNLKRIDWRHGTQGDMNCYEFEYNNLDRLVVARFVARDTVTGEPKTYPDGTPDYSAAFGYDLNTNITSLLRMGFTRHLHEGNSQERVYDRIDDVVFTHDGNRFNRLDLYDFGARPYDPTRCAFLTGDPLAEDDPATGPTAFCAANPVRFTDPTGMIVYLYGEEAQTALSQLQERYDKYLTLSINNNALSYTIKKDEKGKNVKLNGEVKRLTNIIDDKSIEVLMAAKNTMTTSKCLEHLGGAFMGNSYSPDLIMAFQEVNPIVLSGIDCGDVGSSLMHELTEAYEGALIARKNKESTPPAMELNSVEIKNIVYEEAHRKATPQKGIFVNYYDKEGNLVDQNSPKRAYRALINENGEIIHIFNK